MNTLGRVTILITSFMFIAGSAAFAANPYRMADETWISLSGTVTSVSADRFMLDYGDGIVTVEMDDWDADADGYKVMDGDKVTVTGKVDDDLFETTSIEASSVYVEDLNTYFYASAADEEDFDSFVTYTTPIIISSMTVQGTVTEIDGDDFILNTGERAIRVDTEDMLYDPLDDLGYQQIDVGDRVSVTGEMDREFFEGRQLMADSILTLSNS